MKSLPALIEEIPLPSWIKYIFLLFLFSISVLGTWKTILWLCRTAVNFFGNLYARIMWQDCLHIELSEFMNAFVIRNAGKLDISDTRRVFAWDVKTQRELILVRKSPKTPVVLKKGDEEHAMLWEMGDSFTATTLVFIFYPVLGLRRRWVGVCFPAAGGLSYYWSDFEESGKGLGELSVLTRKFGWLPREVKRYVYDKSCESGFVPSPLSPYVRLKNKSYMEKVKEAIPAYVWRLHQELEQDKLERTEKALREWQEEAGRPRKKKYVQYKEKKSEEMRSSEEYKKQGEELSGELLRKVRANSPWARKRQEE